LLQDFSLGLQAFFQKETTVASVQHLCGVCTVHILKMLFHHQSMIQQTDRRRSPRRNAVRETTRSQLETLWSMQMMKWCVKI